MAMALSMGVYMGPKQINIKFKDNEIENLILDFAFFEEMGATDFEAPEILDGGKILAFGSFKIQTDEVLERARC